VLVVESKARARIAFSVKAVRNARRYMTRSGTLNYVLRLSCTMSGNGRDSALTVECLKRDLTAAFVKLASKKELTAKPVATDTRRLSRSSVDVSQFVSHLGNRFWSESKRKRHADKTLDCLDFLFRDQEVDGSNPFAPTTPKFLPLIGLG
jgi:hypothetical protein